MKLFERKRCYLVRGIRERTWRRVAYNKIKDIINIKVGKLYKCACYEEWTRHSGAVSTCQTRIHVIILHDTQIIHKSDSNIERHNIDKVIYNLKKEIIHKF